MTSNVAVYGSWVVNALADEIIVHPESPKKEVIKSVAYSALKVTIDSVSESSDFTLLNVAMTIGKKVAKAFCTDRSLLPQRLLATVGHLDEALAGFFFH